jgi:hypothetical protein
MNSFYEIVGYIVAYCNYVILFFFIIKPKKIKLIPFNYYFINIILSIILDLISLYLHRINYQGNSFFYKLIMPLYAVNNILFLGLFLSHFVNKTLRKAFQYLSFFLSIVITSFYLFDTENKFSTWGMLSQTLILLIFFIFTFRDLQLNSINIPNRKSALIIIIGWILGLTLTFFIFLYFNETKNIDSSYANLLYGIQNTFWIISNLLSAYAIHIITLKPTSSPKPSPPLPKLN